MSLTVVGSIAFDSVETPFGSRERMLGGSAVHFSLAASFFTDVQIVGPVGDDFGPRQLGTMEARGVDTSDIEKVEDGKTFFWRGHYDFDLNTAHTDETQLNVFADFNPKLSAQSSAAETLFLANIQPTLQKQVREQCQAAKFVALDSMNLWIDTARDELIETIGLVDCVIINDAEIRQLTDKPNLVQAAKQVMEWGPKTVVAKQGEYGAALFNQDGYFALPAYPLESVLDPTGAGDSFAGGFVGYIAAHIGSGLDKDTLRRAMAYGTAMASFNVGGFGTERVSKLTPSEISARVNELQRITHFEDAPIQLRGE